jgi:hypothetical protein
VSGAGDVKKLLAAARRVAGDPAIAEELVRSTGLSRENVAIGLSRHLEIDATDAEIDALASGAAPAEAVHVILSASVFVAPLRAIALALAASDRVTVRPSRREPIFARALALALGDPRVRIEEARDVGSIVSGEIHVYGRDETIASVRGAARPGIVVRGHGAGFGVALVAGEPARAAEALAEDVTAFDQRGCLSPRLAFVVGDARGFARAAFDALEARGRRVPRGALEPAESEDAARWSSAIAYGGELHRGASCMVGLLPSGGGLDARALPPTGRHLLVRPLGAPAELGAALGELARFVLAVGADVPVAVPAHARLSALGAMQRPPLDGPVDRRGA